MSHRQGCLHLTDNGRAQKTPFLSEASDKKGAFGAPEAPSWAPGPGLLSEVLATWGVFQTELAVLSGEIWTSVWANNDSKCGAVEKKGPATPPTSPDFCQTRQTLSPGRAPESAAHLGRAEERIVRRGENGAPLAMANPHIRDLSTEKLKCLWPDAELHPEVMYASNPVATTHVSMQSHRMH